MRAISSANNGFRWPHRASGFFLNIFPKSLGKVLVSAFAFSCELPRYAWNVFLGFPEHVVNLPHDRLRPLNRSGNYGFGPGARLVVEQVFGSLQVSSYLGAGQNCQRLQSSSIEEVRKTYRDADPVGPYTVFNIKGNSYRLLVKIEYEYALIFIKHVLTHAEYDQRDWTI